MDSSLEKVIVDLRKEIEELKSALNNQTHIAQEFIDRKGIMQMFNISYPTIYNWENYGWLTPIKKKRRIYYSYGEIQEFKNQK